MQSYTFFRNFVPEPHFFTYFLEYLKRCIIFAIDKAILNALFFQSKKTERTIRLKRKTYENVI